MSWNYRVIEFVNSLGERYQAIHGVMYDESGQPTSWTVNPETVLWDADEVGAADEFFAKLEAARKQPVLIEVDNKLVEKT